MADDAKITRTLKMISWAIPGAAFTLATISSIIYSEFVLKRTIWGSLILTGLWVVLYLFFKIQKIRPDDISRIVFPGRQVNLFFIGAITALWMPLVFQPFKTQKVEIILDTSPRMWEEFDPPGTTKFDAARSGVLDVLGYLEYQNMQVSLRLVNSIEAGQCVIEPRTSLAVDFTKDLDKIRNYLDTIQPARFDEVPVVNAIDFSIDHYLNERIFDKKFYVYSFIGGEDTCGKKLGVYLTSPKVVDNAVTSEIFLVVLLGTGEDATLRNLPNAKLDYARNAAQVEEIVDMNNQLIEIPTPTPTASPSPSPSPIPVGVGGDLIPFQTDIVIDAPGRDPNTSLPASTSVIPSTPMPTFTNTALPTFTLPPPPTFTFVPPTPIPPTPVPPTPIPPPHVELLSYNYLQPGIGCQVDITVKVTGGPATGSFHVWNANYPPEGDIYDPTTLSDGTYNNNLVTLGGLEPQFFRHRVWFEYNGVASNVLEDLICPGLTPSP